MHEVYCRQERRRLNEIDFEKRFNDLTHAARASNISFYPIGVWNPHPALPAELLARGFRWPEHPPAELVDSLLALAKDTDGFIVPPQGNVVDGLKRIAGDVGTHYLLGYYTTNTKWDGRIHSIRVRLKRTGAEIRARSEYRAPTARGHRRPLGTAQARWPRGARSRRQRALDAQRISTVGTVLRLRRDRRAGHSTSPSRPPRSPLTQDAGTTAPQSTSSPKRPQVTPSARPTAVCRPTAAPRCRSRSTARRRRRTCSSASTPRATSVTARVQVGVDPASLVGDPLGFRSSARGLAIPAASFVFARDEKLRLEWPVLGAVDRYEVRLLDRYGLPLKFRIAVEDQPVLGARRLVATLSFSSLGRGDYVIELVAAAGDTKEAHYLAVRVN